MSYSKEELLKLKKELTELLKEEKRYRMFNNFNKFGALVTATSSTVSLSMYLNKNLEMDKMLTIGGSCLLVSGIFSIASHLVNKETQAVVEEIEMIEMNCPDEIIDEVYDTVYHT